MPPSLEEDEYEEEVDETIDRNALDQDEEGSDDEDFGLDDLSSDPEEEEKNEDHRRTKKKTKRNQFVETEALVGDDEEDEEESRYTRRRRSGRASREEEDEEEDDFIEEDESELLEAQQTYSRLLAERRAHPRALADVDDQTLAKEAEEETQRIKSLYGRSSAAAARAAAAAEEQGFLPETFLTPTVQDPKLWMVRCRPGKERLLAFNMMRRYLTMTASADLSAEAVPKIFSVVVREPLLKGFIYVEAFTKQEVLTFCERMPNCWSSSITLVPINEMPEVLRPSERYQSSTSGSGAAHGLKSGAWVRIKRGKYANDLAQVLAVDEGEDGLAIARLRLLPRLSFGKGGGGHGAAVTERPSAQLFNPVEVAERARLLGIPGPTRSSTPGYWMFGGEYFKDGFLEREIKATGVEVQTMLPTLDELEVFGGFSAVDAGSATDAAILFIERGSSVLVTEGELLGRKGIVEDIIDEGEIALVSFDQQTTLSVPMKSLRKIFQIGDSVRVLRGTSAGTVGLVTRVQGVRVTLFSQSSKSEFEVLARDLGPSEASNSEDNMYGRSGSKAAIFGRPENITFAIEELVMLAGHGPGLIVKIDTSSKEPFFIIDSHSILCERIKETSIQKLRPSKFAMDSVGAVISIGDTIQMLHGASQNLTGRIVSIYRSTIWVALAQPFPIIAVRASSVILANGGGTKILNLPPSAAMRQQKGASSRRLRGRTVLVREGPYKGLTALVKELEHQGQVAWIELHTNSKRVSVPVSALSEVDSKGDSQGHPGSYGQQKGFSTPSGFPMVGSNAGFATPAGLERSGWRTPGAANAGFRTPGGAGGGQFDLGSRTPGYFGATATGGAGGGDRTPAYFGIGDRTPSGFAMGSRTPSAGFGAAEGWRTPASGGFLGGTVGARNANLEGGSGTPTWQQGTGTPTWQQGSGTPTWQQGMSPWGAAPPMSGAVSPWGRGSMQSSQGHGTPSSSWNSHNFSGGGGMTPLSATHRVDDSNDDANFEASWARPSLHVMALINGVMKSAIVTGHCSGSLIPIESIEEPKIVSEVPPSQLRLQRPVKKDRVVVLAGDHLKTTGILVGIDGADAIVRVDAPSSQNASGFIIVPALLVGKLGT
ncbi:transcription elongation factor spt5 [Mitosporidium daphniae]